MIDQFPEPSAVVVPKTVVPFVSYKVTVAPAVAPLPVNVGVVMFVILSLELLPLSVPLVISGDDGAVGPTTAPLSNVPPDGPSTVKLNEPVSP